jgi:hypothetical protein
MLLSLLPLASLAQSALPALGVEYSADRIMETSEGTFAGKVNMAGPKQRSTMSMGGMESVMIVRADQKKGYMLMPSQRMAMEVDYAQARSQSGGPPDDVSISEAGKETIEGFETTKYKLLMKDGSAGGFMWITRDGIVMKMDMLTKERGKKSRMTLLLKNVKIGEQDAALFEVPKGYVITKGSMGLPRMGPRR